MKNLDRHAVAKLEVFGLEHGAAAPWTQDPNRRKTISQRLARALRLSARFPRLQKRLPARCAVRPTDEGRRLSPAPLVTAYSLHQEVTCAPWKLLDAWKVFLLCKKVLA